MVCSWSTTYGRLLYFGANKNPHAARDDADEIAKGFESGGCWDVTCRPTDGMTDSADDCGSRITRDRQGECICPSVMCRSHSVRARGFVSEAQTFPYSALDTDQSSIPER
jgi:hypothetical protein